MPISQIVDIQPSPRGGYETDYGYVYTFDVAFQDGTEGEAGSKSDWPPYNVGDTMAYTATHTEYGTRLKIQKPDFNRPQQQQQPQQRPPPRQGPTRQQQRPQQPQHQPTIHGGTVGMAIKEAIGLTKQSPGTEAWSREVALYASDIIRLSQMLERGKLQPSVRERNAVQRDDPPPPPEPQGYDGEDDLSSVPF